MKTASLISFIVYISSLSTTSANQSHAQVARRVQARASSITTPTSTQTTSAPSTAPTDSSTAQDIQTLHERRLSNIVGALTNASSIANWLSTLDPNGQWPDVDYTTGCPAQRANWPAELVRSAFFLTRLTEFLAALE